MSSTTRRRTLSAPTGQHRHTALWQVCSSQLKTNRVNMWLNRCTGTEFTTRPVAEHMRRRRH